MIKKSGEGETMEQVYLIEEEMILKRLHFSVQYANFDKCFICSMRPSISTQQAFD